MMPEPLQYECVVCTRNRLGVLRLAVPLLLAQTRPPARIIVVDSSDDHESVRETIAGLAVEAGSEVLVMHSEPGLTTQRNRGLELVEAPIVIFPDDDSFCDPDYAATLLEVYERDTAGVIGCVIGSPRPDPPGTAPAAEVPRPAWRERLRQTTTTPRMKLERRIVLDPLISIGEELVRSWSAPEWLGDIDGELNAWVRGFRMSFRTSALREAGGFDETLRGYATFEDTATGLAVGRRHMIFQSRHALVYHQQAPGGRGSGRVRGATNIANRAYVVARHSAPGSVHRRRAVTYGAYRCLLYGAGSLWSSYHRESFRGALAALVRLRPLLRSPPHHAPDAYRALLVAAGVRYD